MVGQMNIDQSIIDEVVRKNDIVEIIGKHLKIKRSGSNYFACCPFHNEKSASFSINTNKQFFHCFGCGESGNVITFIMKYNGLDFIEAIKSLAASSGVYIPENKERLSLAKRQEQKQHQLNLKETVNQVVQYYQNSLINSSVASHYMINRGVSNDMVQKFLIGYAPDIPNSLANIFKNHTENKSLINAGLTIHNEATGRVFDRFRDRIMFPIRNIRGEAIGFGGRIIAKGEPKYLNSPETELFNKSQELYGLFEAQKHIQNKEHVIVVEGYMDVIAMFQFGIDNVVATMGTAATDSQIKKLFRLCDDIYYCFDGDMAGHKAAKRALERSIPLITDNKMVHFIFLPKEDDPDSFLRKYGIDKFKQYKETHSMSMSDFLFNQLSSTININTNEGRAKLISQAKPYIEQIQATAMQVMLKKQLAHLVELPPNTLESILNNRSRYAFYTHQLNNVSIPQRTKIPLLSSIEVIISNALKNIDWVTRYNLPDSIDNYSREIQELVLLLDFINNNCDSGIIELPQIKEHFKFTSFNLDKIYSKNDCLNINHEDFIKSLDVILGRSKHKAIKIPKIKLKGN